MLALLINENFQDIDLLMIEQVLKLDEILLDENIQN